MDLFCIVPVVKVTFRDRLVVVMSMRRRPTRPVVIVNVGDSRMVTKSVPPVVIAYVGDSRIVANWK